MFLESGPLKRSTLRCAPRSLLLVHLVLAVRGDAEVEDDEERRRRRRRLFRSGRTLTFPTFYIIFANSAEKDIETRIVLYIL